MFSGEIATMPVAVSKPAIISPEQTDSDSFQVLPAFALPTGNLVPENADNQRLDDVELKLMDLENTVLELNDVILKQYRDIERLQMQHEELLKRTGNSAVAEGNTSTRATSTQATSTQATSNQATSALAPPYCRQSRIEGLSGCSPRIDCHKRGRPDRSDPHHNCL